MERLFISIVLVCFTTVSFAQSNAELASNQPVKEGGYFFEFNYGLPAQGAPEFTNCMTGGPYTQKINYTAREGVRASYIKLDSIKNGAISFKLDEQYVPGSTIVSLIQKDNCASGVYNLYDKNKSLLKGVVVKVKSSIDIAEFGVYLGFIYRGKYVEGDNNIKTQSLKAGEYTYMHFPVTNIMWNGTKLDSTKCVGFSIGASNGKNPVIGSIEIDFVRIGQDAPTNTVGVFDKSYSNFRSGVYPASVKAEDELFVSGLSGFTTMRLLKADGQVVVSSKEAKLKLTKVPAGLYILEIVYKGTPRTEIVHVK